MFDRAPLLLLPGLLCDDELWVTQVQDLADIVDCRIADLSLDDNVQAMASRILSAAPPRFNLAALSMGGYVAFEILRQAPQRVMRLALLDTSASPDTADRIAERRRAIDSLRLGRFLGVTNGLLPQLVHRDHVDGQVGESVKHMAKRVGREAFLRQQLAILARPDSRPLLASIDMPTLIAVGEGDRLTPPAEAWFMRDAIPHAAFHIFPTCGHLPPLELPAETSAVLRNWLKD